MYPAPIDKRAQAGTLMERPEITRRYLEALSTPAQQPNLRYLDELVRRHVARFTFASIGPRLGEELPLDLPALYDRIVVRGRGGYCFEQNGLFYEVLDELGFQVELYLARVVYNRDVHPGLTHRITLVTIDGAQYVADVGFGSMGPRAAVNLAGTPSRQGADCFRIAEPRPGEFHVQVLKGDDWFTIYRFELARYGQSDCELGHFFSHRHPDATFVNNLVASRILDQEIRSLRNREYRIITANSEQVQTVASAAQLRALLADEFDLQVSESESRLLFANRP
jgi:N-hydroxyarylamine O-acetyltransferase